MSQRRENRVRTKLRKIDDLKLKEILKTKLAIANFQEKLNSAYSVNELVYSQLTYLAKQQSGVAKAYKAMDDKQLINVDDVEDINSTQLDLTLDIETTKPDVSKFDLDEDEEDSD